MFPLIFSRKNNSTIFTQFSSKRCSAILRSFSVILLVIHFKVNKIQSNLATTQMFSIRSILNDSVQQNIPRPCHNPRCWDAVFIINNLNALRYYSGTMDTKSLFRLSFNKSDKKTLTLALVCSESYYLMTMFWILLKNGIYLKKKLKIF
jgi:hypothetical protein